MCCVLCPEDDPRDREVLALHRTRGVVPVLEVRLLDDPEMLRGGKPVRVENLDGGNPRVVDAQDILTGPTLINGRGRVIKPSEKNNNEVRGSE